ncbi:cadherin repeat domain-containing protein [uncultured Pseudoteredinibacter sp.]|uniref:cadherin repeat domain-containing protein n=1 Tax=uncultured Pseudoteredinibacter sp. TaxID=1641701 RepID=UPI00263893C7|nr:cadherin repeat domain-containing protein [uncultured Pseudoteredinibacter sp.]
MQSKLKILAASILAASVPQSISAFDLNIAGQTCTGFTEISVVTGNDGNVTVNTTGGDINACLTGGGGGTPDDQNSNDHDPVITTSSSRSITENNTDVVTLAASDSDVGSTGTFAYSIVGGADQALFELTGAASNVLSFRSAPDYETPASSNTSNTYVVELQVTDNDTNGARTANKTINVTVNNDPADDGGGGGGACGALPSNVNLTSAVWDLDNPGNTEQINVARTDIRSIPFETPAAAVSSGYFAFTSVTGTSRVRRSAWISECPGQQPDLDSVAWGCKGEGTSQTQVKFQIGQSGWYCDLQPNTRYYINVVNENCTSSTCNVYRQANIK